ncbi:MAG: DUF268 domain-containing protein [Acidobacteriota bacterium]|nr:DUF268 domain-containing protein [Acidobacteriota bacterium]
MPLITRLNRAFQIFGMDLIVAADALRSIGWYVNTARKYQRLCDDDRFKFHITHARPLLHDRFAQAGALGHYFHMDLWAARKVHARHPTDHLDVGSRIDGFIAHLLSFMCVAVIDIRPLKSDIEGLTFIQEDATLLTGIPDNSIRSLSSLHAVEHFGLGRYGDPIAPNAWSFALDALARVLQPGGYLYFATPIGTERVEFNSQRVFYPETIIEAFGSLELVSFSAVDDNGKFHENAIPGDFRNARHACGLFEFTKPPTTSGR